MRLKLKYTIRFLVLLFICSSWGNDDSKKLNDFRVFRSVLIEKEGKIDLHTSKDSINLYMDQLRDQLEKTNSLLEQYKLYSATLAKIQCGHTQIHPTKNVLREWLASKKSLPFDYYLIGKKLVVNKTLQSDYSLINEGKSLWERNKTIPENSEIIEIDGKNVSEMMDKIGIYLSSDENSTDFKYFQAAQLFDFYRHLSAPFIKDSIEVKFVHDNDSSILFFKPGAAPVKTMNERLSKNEAAFRREEQHIGNFKLINKNYAFFRFPSFNASYGNKYEVFLKQSFKQIKEQKIEKLIIDLRGNTGGAMQYSLIRYFVGKGVYLGTYTVEKPKTGIENKHIKKFDKGYLKHSRMSKVQKRCVKKGEFDQGKIYTDAVDESLLYKGEIVVITDEGTFSSAAMLACHLKTMCNAKIIGSPAGGSFYSGNSGTIRVLLPYSEFKLFVNPNTFTSHLKLTDNPTTIKTPDRKVEALIINPDLRDAFFLQQAMRSF